MKHCLVTGASGFVGRKLTQHLKNQGIQVRALFRHSSKGDWDDSVLFDFNRLHENALPDHIMESIDTVFHLAGINHALATMEEYQSINIEATIALFLLAIKNGVKRFIYFSSVKAIDPAANDRYGYSKKIAEEAILNLSKQHDIHLVILRPSMVYGPGMKGSLLALIRQIDKGFFPPVPKTATGGAMISVEELAEVALFVASQEKSNQKIYTITDGSIYPTRSLYDGIREVLGLSKMKWTVPRWLLYLICCPILRKPFLYNRWMKPVFYSNEFICQDLGWKPKRNVYHSLPSIVEYYRGCRAP